MVKAKENADNKSATQPAATAVAPGTPTMSRKKALGTTSKQSIESSSANAAPSAKTHVDKALRTTKRSDSPIRKASDLNKPAVLQNVAKSSNFEQNIRELVENNMVELKNEVNNLKNEIVTLKADVTRDLKMAIEESSLDIIENITQFEARVIERETRVEQDRQALFPEDVKRDAREILNLDLENITERDLVYNGFDLLNGVEFNPTHVNTYGTKLMSHLYTLEELQTSCIDGTKTHLNLKILDIERFKLVKSKYINFGS